VVLTGASSWGALLPVLVVNLVGSVVLGTVVALADDVVLLSPETRLFLAVGLLGGFTTFSTFGWGADVALAHGDTLSVIFYISGSALGGIAAAAFGIWLGHAAIRWAGYAPPTGGGDGKANLSRIELEDRE
jgi:CrcB protein